MLKLRTGPRAFMVVCCLFGAALLLLLAVPVTLRASIVYDHSTLSIPTFYGGRSMHR